MIDYHTAIRTESARFAAVIRNTDPTAPVPSCPGWSAADLTWHLLEVQYFWASIVADLLDTPENVTELVRPADAELGDLFDAQTSRLLDALQSHDPAERCWSWHSDGHSVGWVLRRQAHEALIHRIDAELAHGGDFAVDAQLATDGVDEVLKVMLDASDIPDWSSFTPDGRFAEISANEGPSWALRLGRFQGKSPQTGTDYDDPALVVTTSVASPDVAVRGSGPDLNLWLWGRGTADSLVVEGDASGVAHLRAAAVAGTQ